MSARERVREFGNPPSYTEPWSTVHRRKPKTKTRIQQASKTCFVDFLPLNICEYDIAKTFEPYGPIENIFIPEKIRPKRKHRFAFVRFVSSSSQALAIRNENGRRLSGGRLRVFAAKKDFSSFHPTHAPHPKAQPKTSPNHNQNTPTVSSYRDHRSYKDVSLNLKPSQPTKPPTPPPSQSLPK